MARRCKTDPEFDVLVAALFDAGVKSTTLLSEALNASDEACRQALIRLRKHEPRRNLRDTLAGLDEALRVRTIAYAKRRRDPTTVPMLELPTETSADGRKVA